MAEEVMDRLRTNLMQYFSEQKEDEIVKLLILCGAAHISMLKTTGHSKSMALQRVTELADEIYKEEAESE